MSCLTPENRAYILDTLYNGGALTHCARKMGVSHVAIWRAIQRDPLFAEEVKDARLCGADVMADSTLDFVDDLGDARLAEAKANIIWRHIGVTNRAKYGQQVEINLNQTVSIDKSFELAAGRLAPLLHSSRQVEEIVVDDIAQLL